jgi:hypothetical protein
MPAVGGADKAKPVMGSWNVRTVAVFEVMTPTSPFVPSEGNKTYLPAHWLTVHAAVPAVIVVVVPAVMAAVACVYSMVPMDLGWIESTG